MERAGVEGATPYALRHSFASLLLHEGRSVIYVARQLGHDARLTLSTYGHVIDELDEAPQDLRRGRDPGRPRHTVFHWCAIPADPKHRASGSSNEKAPLSGAFVCEWAMQDSNLRPLPYQRSALTD